MSIWQDIGHIFSPSESKTTTQQVQKWTPEQQALFNTLVGQTSQATQGPAPSYPGQMYTPTTPEEATYFTKVAQEPAAYETLLSGKPGYEVGPEAAENLWSKYYEPIFAKEHAAMLESLGGGGSSALSSSMRALAEPEFATRKAGTEAGLYYNEELARRAAIDTALGRVAPTRAQQLTETGTAGAYARQIANEKVAADLQRYLMGEQVGGVYNPVYNPNVQLALALLGMSPFQYMTSTEATGGGLLSSLGGVSLSYTGASKGVEAAA